MRSSRGAGKRHNSRIHERKLQPPFNSVKLIFGDLMVKVKQKYQTYQPRKETHQKKTLNPTASLMPAHIETAHNCLTPCQANTALVNKTRNLLQRSCVTIHNTKHRLCLETFNGAPFETQCDNHDVELASSIKQLNTQQHISVCELIQRCGHKRDLFYQ